MSSLLAVTSVNIARADTAPLQWAATKAVTVTATRNPTAALTYPGMVNVVDFNDI